MRLAFCLVTFVRSLLKRNVKIDNNLGWCWKCTPASSACSICHRGRIPALMKGSQNFIDFEAQENCVEVIQRRGLFDGLSPGGRYVACFTAMARMLKNSSFMNRRWPFSDKCRAPKQLHETVMVYNMDGELTAFEHLLNAGTLNRPSIRQRSRRVTLPEALIESGTRCRWKTAGYFDRTELSFCDF